MAHKFEIFKDKVGEFRVRFKHNGEVIFATEGYASKSSAMNAIAAIKKNAPNAPIEDNTQTEQRSENPRKEVEMGFSIQAYRETGLDDEVLEWPIFVTLMCDEQVICSLEIRPDVVISRRPHLRAAFNIIEKGNT